MRKLAQIFVTLLLVSFATPATAQQLPPEEFGVSPLADNLRKPVEAFLFATGWRNADKLIDAARSWQVLDQVVLIRIVHETTCDKDKDLCLTIIGSLRNGGFVSEAVFFAGGKVQFSDSADRLLSEDGPALFRISFFGKRQGVKVFPAPTGWIIVPALPEN